MLTGAQHLPRPSSPRPPPARGRNARALEYAAPLVVRALKAQELESAGGCAHRVLGQRD